MTQKEFTHFISTRFNVPTEVWNKTRAGQKPLSDEWMEDRFGIFMKYCLPSFKIQKNRDFVWLVYFDVNTAPKYRTIISTIAEQCNFFQPVFVRNFSEMHASFVDKVRSAATPFVITSDVDNDDMLHQHYVTHVQRLFQPVHDTVIDLKSGIQITETAPGKANANRFYMTANPFVSLVEETARASTVMKEEHPKFRNYEHQRTYDEAPMFIQFIHRHNLVNDTVRQAKRLTQVNFREFGIADADTFKISAVDAGIHNTLRNFHTLKNLIVKK